MAGGLPIICAITVPSSQVSEAGCGICVDSGSTDAVVDAVIEMSGNSPEKMKELGERGKKAVREKYRYDILAKFELATKTIPFGYPATPYRTMHPDTVDPSDIAKKIGRAHV